MKSAWYKILTAVLALLAVSQAIRAEGPPLRYFAANPGALAKAKARLAAGDRSLAKALTNLVADANAALGENPPSVMEKTKLPPSGDRHDYMSLAPYYWPNPATKDGLPYVRHDGKVNPESRDEHLNDSPRVRIMGDTIDTLALAYYFTGNEAYAAQAAKFARTWFLDPATRMNPDLKFAQAIPGRNDGRGTGILEGRNIATAADGLGLLAASPSWPAADQRQLDVWLNAYLDWLLTSKPGADEHGATNNHGAWFDVQTARLALCLGRTNDAHRILEEAKQGRIAVQILPDGRQPLELERTKSQGYSRFNLEALCELATLGEYAGVDLWHFQTADGRSIRRALEFLLPYVDRPAKPWPYEQIKDISPGDQAEFMSVLRQAELACAAPGYETIIAKYPEARGKRFQLLFVK